MSATLASPLNTGSTVPALTPVTVPCKTPTCAWAPAAPSNSAMTIDDFFSSLMSALRNRVARRLAGKDALYWRRREFGYPSQNLDYRCFQSLTVTIDGCVYPAGSDVSPTATRDKTV